LAQWERAVIITPMASVSSEQPFLRRFSCPARSFAVGAALAVGVIATGVHAVDDATLHIDSVEGDGWSASGVAVNLGLPPENALARATIARLHISALAQTLTDVRIECPKLDLGDEVIACPQARLVADWPALGPQSLTANLVYGRRDGSIDVALDGLRIGDGRAAIRGVMRDAGWTVKLNLQSVPIERLMKLAQDFKLPMPPLTATGRVNLTATASGAQASVREAKLDGSLVELTANSESGSLASDKLSLQLQASLRGSPKEWQFDVAVQSSQGQAFAQPIFLDLSAHAISASARGRLKDGVALTLDRFVLDHADVAQGSGTAQVRLDHEQPVRALQLQLTALKFPGAYASYLQPLLLDTSFKALQTSGSIGGVVRVERGEPRLIDLNFADLTVDDGAGGLNLTALKGQLHWLAEESSDDDEDDGGTSAAAVAEVQQSHLQWHGGALFGLALGPSELRFSTRGRQFRLMQPARIPVLDGSIDLEAFRVRNAGSPSVAFLVDATIQPISVQQLCKAFGWPEFGGQVGGVISKLRMREGIITLGTTLRAQVFNGAVTISDLRLEQPFGQWPRFYSSIALDNLDLEPMTRAFSFGLITGRVSGAINGLQLFNWVPTAFDARLYTPPNDRSRHRISQRAVENIGSIGGGGAGVTAALSGGLLRFFEDFNYDRLGISCRLTNEVCVMDGVAPAPDGNYYLVKGKGLPRIDVIGNSRRVDWARLVQQLIALTESEGPIVR
jgi:hypothetical protein